MGFKTFNSHRSAASIYIHCQLQNQCFLCTVTSCVILVLKFSYCWKECHEYYVTMNSFGHWWTVTWFVWYITGNMIKYLIILHTHFKLHYQLYMCDECGWGYHVMCWQISLALFGSTENVQFNHAHTQDKLMSDINLLTDHLRSQYSRCAQLFLFPQLDLPSIATGLVSAVRYASGWHV